MSEKEINTEDLAKQLAKLEARLRLLESVLEVKGRDIRLHGSGSLRVEAQNIQIESFGELTVKSNAPMQVETSTQLNIKSALMTNIQSGVDLKMVAPIIRLN